MLLNHLYILFIEQNLLLNVKVKLYLSSVVILSLRCVAKTKSFYGRVKRQVSKNDFEFSCCPSSKMM